jgi:hypothetical protein
MASTSAAIDMAGSAAPEVARLLADTTHNGQIRLDHIPDPALRDLLATNADGTRRVFSGAQPATVSVSEAMSKLEGQEAFGQMKKVYTNQFQAQQQAGQAGAGAPGAGAAAINPTISPTP